jgi:hypothetical protein
LQYHLVLLHRTAVHLLFTLLFCDGWLCQALLVELLELKAQHARASESRTVLGHLKNALGYAMSGYCIYRVITSAKALVMGEDFSSDPVSR